MTTARMIILFGLGLSIILFSSCSSKSNLFITFANESQVGSTGLMVNDGDNLWFSSHFGPLIKYNLSKKEYYTCSFNEESRIEGIMCMELINGEVWIGLHTRGIAIFDDVKGTFKFIGMDDGLPGIIEGKKKISKVTSIVLDREANRLLVGTIHFGVSFYNYKTKKWNIVDDSLVKDTDVTSISISRGLIAVGADQGLFFCDKISGLWKDIKNLPKFHKIRDIIFLFDNKIVFVLQQGYGSSIMEYDYVKDELINIKSSQNDMYGIKKLDDYLVLYTIGGITFYNYNTKKSQHFDESDGIISNAVNNVYFFGDDIWVLTQKGISKASVKNILKVLQDNNV